MCCRCWSRLTAEVDVDGSELTQAAIWEVQRTRPVIEAMFRVTTQRIRLGGWVIPAGHGVMPSITLTHDSPRHFADPHRFDPDRFLGASPDSLTRIPYGGGVRRCLGAAFANMEMTVTLRNILREFTFGTTRSAAERRRSRGIATAPHLGGRVVVYRRRGARADQTSAVPFARS